MDKKITTREKINIIKNNKILLGYIFKFAPEMFLWKRFGVIMILASDISFNILFMKYVVDSISANADFRIVILYILGLGLIRVVCDFANIGYSQLIEPVGRLKMHKGIYNLVYEKIETIDLEKFDDSEFYNDYIWALNEVDNRAKNTFNVFIQLMQCILNIITYSTLSIVYDKWIILFVVIPVIINTIVGVKKASVTYNLVNDLTPVNRKRDYSRRAFYLKQFAKEIKNSSIGTLLRRNFNDCVDESISITKSYRGKLFGMTYCEVHTGWLFAKILSAAYMSYRVLISGAYTAGVFVVMYQSIGTFTNSLLTLFAVIPRLQENGLFAERLLKIINYESKIEQSNAEKEVPDSFQKIEFKNLSFTYPNSKEATLRNLNFAIKRGEKVAFAGINGAGKTTIVKLLMRLYDPTEGSILMDGVDIKNFNIKEYRQKFSTIFQDYQLFAVKLSENVFMRKTDEKDNAVAAEYLRQSRLEGFEDKIENVVTKEFDKDGIVFSGGQSQKVAIARALAKDGSLMIMDEASASLDPISEAEIYEMVMQGFSDKTFIVISHRLSAIQGMDNIYFLENGEIVEHGRHEQLIKQQGKYAQMYNVQAEKYKV